MVAVLSQHRRQFLTISWVDAASTGLVVVEEAHVSHLRFAVLGVTGLLVEAFAASLVAVPAVALAFPSSEWPALTRQVLADAVML